MPSAFTAIGPVVIASRMASGVSWLSACRSGARLPAAGAE